MPATQAISIRMSEKDRQLIDSAANVLHKSRTQFMLDSARTAATDALLDQRLFLLDEEEFKKFEEALAKAPTIDEIIANIDRRLAK
jgi:uncharacterized protein (DUF1778 family)